MSYFFRLSTLKGTAKTPAVDLFRLSTPRGTKTASLTPKRYNEHPPSFFYGIPHQGSDPAALDPRERFSLFYRPGAGNRQQDWSVGQ